MSVVQINVSDAFELLKKDQNSALVDVRTVEEFTFVGTANSSSFGDRMILLPWQVYPNMAENPNFANALEASLTKLGLSSKETKLLFLCRTGGRSNAAANYAQNLGYQNCYNLVFGFEGESNQDQQRGRINGWKASNLPWKQK